MANQLMNAMVGMHAAIYRRTNGRVFGKVGGQPLLLLTTKGRKTGRERTIPVVFEATAETTERDERARLWAMVVEKYSNFEKYQAKAGREIPVVVLTPKQS